MTLLVDLQLVDNFTKYSPLGYEDKSIAKLLLLKSLFIISCPELFIISNLLPFSADFILSRLLLKIIAELSLAIR